MKIICVVARVGRFNKKESMTIALIDQEQLIIMSTLSNEFFREKS
jgi:hypothetical protein